MRRCTKQTKGMETKQEHDYRCRREKLFQDADNKAPLQILTCGYTDRVLAPHFLGNSRGKILDLLWHSKLTKNLMFSYHTKTSHIFLNSTTGLVRRFGDLKTSHVLLINVQSFTVSYHVESLMLDWIVYKSTENIRLSAFTSHTLLSISA